MMLGMEVTTPWDILIGGREDFDEVLPSDYVSVTKNRLEKAHQVARDTLGAALKRQKRDYDLRLEARTYSVGDVVYLLNPAPKLGEAKKLIPIWKRPYLVSEVLASALYRVQGQKGDSVVHHDRLKICKDRVIPLWLRRRRHALLSTDFPREKQESEVRPEVEPEEEPETEDHLLMELPDYPDIEEEIGELDRVPQTRSGRAVIKPSYLRDYGV